MLSLSTTNRVTFAVNVFGTASVPTVRCVVGDSPAYSFPASKLPDGQYEALIDLPKDLSTGLHPFKVEVLLNGRLFTPINQSLSVDGEAEKPAPPAPAPAPAPAARPTESPNVSSLMKAVSTPQPNIQIEIPPTVEVAQLVDVPAPPLQGLATLAKTPVFSKPPTVEHRPIKISMAEIASASEAIEPKPKTKVATKVAPIIEARAIPVSLTKGAVIYR